MYVGVKQQTLRLITLIIIIIKIHVIHQLFFLGT